MKRLLFDIEGNGLLRVIRKLWMWVSADLDTGDWWVFDSYLYADPQLGAEVTPFKLQDGVVVSEPFELDLATFTGNAYSYVRPKLRLQRVELEDGCYCYLGRYEDLVPWLEAMEGDDTPLTLIGHFISGFDLPALWKLLGYQPHKTTRVRDTMIQSQVLNYKRFGMKGHSLKVWGQHLGNLKVEHEDWSQWSVDMVRRCWQDVGVNIEVYDTLLNELNTKAQKHPLLLKSIRNEQEVTTFCGLAELGGWPFDSEGCKKLLNEIYDQMLAIELQVTPMLKPQIKIIDKEPREAKTLKGNGCYNVQTCRYFEVEPEAALLAVPPIDGPFQRIEFIEPTLGSLEPVKELLDSLGWVPDDWNWKRGEGGEPIRGAPKLTTTSLLPLGPVGEALDKYYTLRSRHQILSGWLEEVQPDGTLHGSCFTIATPTGRARHSGIVNVPSADGESLYGAEIRKLFVAPDGWTIVGADSSGNQMRAFCHYLGNAEYTNEVLNGDVHTANMKILQLEVPSTTRKKAKPFLYAFLFGAGNEKLGLILVGSRDARIGKRAKETFTSKTPGLKELTGRILKQLDSARMRTGEMWLTAIDGRMIFVDSKHKALNYLLQSCEAVTCKAALSMFISRMSEEHPEIPYMPLIFYHDEFEVATPDRYAEIVRVIAKECFRDAPKEFGVVIMDGESKAGASWYDVH